MKKVLVSSAVPWLLVGGLAAFQRGDFADGNCSTAADIAMVVVAGPLNYVVDENAGLGGSCSQPTSLD